MAITMTSNYMNKSVAILGGSQAVDLKCKYNITIKIPKHLNTNSIKIIMHIGMTLHPSVAFFINLDTINYFSIMMGKCYTRPQLITHQ